MKTIQIICCENTEFLHKIGVWAIEKSEKTDFNHVAFLIDGFIYEAVFPRARKIRYEDWLKKFKVIRTFEINLTIDQYKTFIDVILSQIGTKYSLFQCFIIWISNSIGVLERSIETTIWNGNKALICSEFVARPIVACLKYKFNNEMDSIGMDEIEDCLYVIAKEVNK